MQARPSPRLQDCRQCDRQDPLAPLRERFALDRAEIYLNGNSLGPQPVAAAGRMRRAVEQEWGRDLGRSWTRAGWSDLPRRLGARIAPLIGAGPDEVVVADSTSVNLYKVLCAAAHRARQAGRLRILAEAGGFPSDLYIARSVAEQHGMTLSFIDPRPLAAQMPADAGIVLLSHVDYRSGRLRDLAADTAAAHAGGALAVWDLAHSAGVVPVALKAAGADYAVGCSYKYLNGGPGAPAFVWAHPRHVGQDRQPLWGWRGHADPYGYLPDYVPAADIGRYQAGMPPLLSMTALACGLDIYEQAEPLGGLAQLRRKSLALSGLFMACVDPHAQALGLTRLTPAEPAQRGAQLSYRVAQGGPAIVAALAGQGVLADCRAPDVLRFAFAPLYLRHEDAWHAAQRLLQVLRGGLWREPRFGAGAP
ncbi:kynureninase [Orrella sp. JC864]|uniref:kynureninase n=1 Tax=Orrella sp. JC864 TaxID=3120298 RepID=UPI003008900B